MALPDSIPTSDPRPRVRRRALLLGLFIAIGMNAFEPLTAYYIHSSSFTNSHIPLGALLGILIPAYLYNPIVRNLAPSWVLDRRDMAAVLAIGFLGGAMPSMAGRFLAVISAPEYFASPENEWPTYVLPNLQNWLYPKNLGNAVGGFYVGLPKGVDIPWGIWVQPMVWWLSFVGCIILACFCLMVILRKQWSERERLAFPLVELPLMLAQDPEPGRTFPAFVGERIFWIGFAVPVVMIFWNMIGHFYPGFPVLSFLNRNIPLAVGRGFDDYFIRFDFYVLCFAYWTPLNILLSMWFFHIVAMTEEGVFNRLGIGVSGGGAGSAAQNAWALTVFVVWGLWMARDQIRDVFRKAIGRAPEVDDSSELLSYRTAAAGFVFATLYIFFWLCQTEMGAGMAFGYMFFSLVLYLGMAKIVALSGLISIRGAYPDILDLVGTPNVGDTTIAAMNQVRGGLYAYAKGFAMTGSANAVRAAGEAQTHKRTLGGLLPVIAMLGVLAFLLVTLILGYWGTGAQNFGEYSYTNGNRHFYDYTVTAIKGRAEATRDWWGLAFGAVGAVTMALLIACSQRFPWWPIHPVGYTVSIQYPTRASFFSIFLAWLIKLVIMKIGGISLYNRSRIFFIGMLLGYVVGVMVPFALDTIFFMGQGHAMHTPPG